MQYIYFGQKKNNTDHKGITCVGYQFNTANQTMEVAVTFCSPQDRFEKKNKVHKTLPGRIAKGKVVVVPNIDKKIKYKDTVKIIKGLLNEAMPKGKDIKTVKDFVIQSDFTEYPKFAGINLPWWFSGV